MNCKFQEVSELWVKAVGLEDSKGLLKILLQCRSLKHRLFKDFLLVFMCSKRTDFECCAHPYRQIAPNDFRNG